MDQFTKQFKLDFRIEKGPFPRSTISKYARYAAWYCLQYGQIAPANRVIQAGMVSKGINADKLAKWMVRAIPHKFDWETKKFGKKYTSTQRHRAAEDFVAKNPDFYKWVPPQKNGSIKEIKEDELSKHVKAIRSSTTEILKGDHKSLTSTEIRTIEKAISDLQSMLYGIRLVSGSTSKSDTKVQFVSGGLPSLGKKRR